MIRKTIRRFFGEREKVRNILAQAAKPVLESLENRRLLSAGDLDTTFNPPNGYISNDFGGSASAGSLAVYPTSIIGSADKIVSVGSANFHIAVARYLPDGTLDASFVGDGVNTFTAGTPGLVSIPVGDASSGNAVAIESDGKIVITGYVSNSITTGYDTFVLRLNDDGSLDTTFGGGIVVEDTPGDQMANDLVLDGADNIYIAGQDFDTDTAVLAKYTTVGVLDPTFGQLLTPGIGHYNLGSGGTQILAVDRQTSNGNLVIGGFVGSNGGIARVLADGSALDPTFGSGGVVLSTAHPSDGIFDVTLDSGGNILTTGFYVDSGTDGALSVRRFDSSGTPDGTFAGDGEQEIAGVGPDDLWFGQDVITDSSGRILVTGYHQDSAFALLVVVARLTPTGAFDSTFGTAGVVQTNIDNLDTGAELALQSDGKIIVTGGSASGFLTLRYLTDPAVPPSPVFIDGDGNLVINGTSGDDTASVVNASGGVKVTLNSVNYGVFAPTGRIIVSAMEGNDTISISASVTIGADIDGGIGNDTLNGGGGNDSIVGGGDDDVISGRNGNDTLAGGSGADSITGGNGDDSILGDAGNDTLRGNAGNDYLDGGDDNDDIAGNADNDTAVGGSGNDSISNDGGNDVLAGGIGDDTLRCGGGADSADGDAGNDSIIGGTGDDTLNGGADNDIIIGGSGNDLIDGGTGDDDLNGQGGSDIVVGGDGADIVQGGTERDILIGGDGTDQVIGNAEDDVLIASATDHDGDSATLQAALAVWNGPGTYAARVATLQSTYFTPDVTVHDDGDVDTLTGGAGTDWFVFNNDGLAIDITDRKPAETGSDVD